MNTTPKKTVTLSVYDRIRQDILNGELLAGQKLRMQSLQDKYSAGNSPIREALNRLLPEGLVEAEEQKGFKVQPLDPVDLMEILQMRCWLEDIAIRESIAKGDMEWEERVLVAHHRLAREPRHDGVNQGSSQDWNHLHEEFHMTLISACESKWLMAYCRNFLALYERYRRNDLDVSFGDRSPREEHNEIMSAALARDADKASQLLQDHYRLTAEGIRHTLESNA